MSNPIEPAPPFDSQLQMFREAPREPSWQALRFMRWLAENGRLEHAVVGPPTGDYARSPTSLGASGWEA